MNALAALRLISKTLAVAHSLTSRVAQRAFVLDGTDDVKHAFQRLGPRGDYDATQTRDIIATLSLSCYQEEMPSLQPSSVGMFSIVFACPRLQGGRYLPGIGHSDVPGGEREDKWLDSRCFWLASRRLVQSLTSASTLCPRPRSMRQPLPTVRPFWQGYRPVSAIRVPFGRLNDPSYSEPNTSHTNRMS